VGVSDVTINFESCLCNSVKFVDMSLCVVLREPRNLTVMALDESLIQMAWRPQQNASYVAVWCKGDAICLVGH